MRSPVLGLKGKANGADTFFVGACANGSERGGSRFRRNTPNWDEVSATPTTNFLRTIIIIVVILLIVTIITIITPKVPFVDVRGIVRASAGGVIVQPAGDISGAQGSERGQLACILINQWVSVSNAEWSIQGVVSPCDGSMVGG